MIQWGFYDKQRFTDMRDKYCSTGAGGGPEKPKDPPPKPPTGG